MKHKEKLIHSPEIVRHNHNTTTKRIDRIRQTINRGNIEPISRLIQQQHIRPFNRQQREHDPALLTLRQGPHQRGLRLPTQAVPAQLLPPILVVLALGGVLVAHEVERRFGEVELLGRVLAVHPELQVGVSGDNSTGGGELAGEDAEEGGFADTVGTHEGGPAVHVDAEIQVLVEVVLGVAGVGEGDVVEGQDGWGQLLDVGEAEGEDAVLGDGLDEAVGFHFIENLLAGFGLADQVGVGTGRGDEGFDVLDFFLLFGVGFHLIGLLFRASLDVGVVVAPVVDELLHPHVNHVCADTVDKVHGVRDQDQCAIPFLEVFFQPHTSFEVKMGGWVVKKEKGWFDEESFGEGDAHPPASRHVPCAFVDGDFVEAETGKDEGGTSLEG